MRRDDFRRANRLSLNFRLQFRDSDIAVCLDLSDFRYRVRDGFRHFRRLAFDNGGRFDFRRFLGIYDDGRHKASN